jgi:hypothetical protein
MVDELGFRALDENAQNKTGATESRTASDSAAHPDSTISRPYVSAADFPAPHATALSVPRDLKISILPVRDGADALVSTMLAQVLSIAGFNATARPILSIEESVRIVTEQKPAMVFLSGMPPVAMARASRLFRNLRTANPDLRIVLGIWNYTEDPTRPAQMISRTEALHVSSSLADALAQAEALTEIGPAVPEPLDSSPQLVATPTDTAA